MLHMSVSLTDFDDIRHLVRNTEVGANGLVATSAEQTIILLSI
jgi:hypothetical protein